MDKLFEKKYHDSESNFFWFLARRDLLLRIIKKYPLNTKILDIGCSSGQLLLELKKIGYQNIYGLDISPEAITIAKNNGLNNVYHGNANKINFPDNYFNIIIASDILEHLNDDMAAMQEWSRLLKPGGIILLAVPAWKFLYSYLDKIAKHYRRYSKQDLKNIIKKNENLNIIKINYWNFFLFIPAAFKKIIEKYYFKKNVATNEYYKINPIINKFFFALLRLENYLIIKNYNIPFGISIICIIKKNDK